VTPWEKAHAIADQCGVSQEEFHLRMARCFADGYVMATPLEFLAVHHDEHNGEPAYFVLMAVGGFGNVVSRFMRYVPKPRPWVLWCRNNEERVRVFAWDKLARKAGLN
jgi:hypothetical protein